MNDLSSLPLKRSYDSGIDDILWNFYIPALSKANRYDRIAGFFSSTSLAISAKGMADFISNGGKMRLVTCPELTKSDVEVIEQSESGIDNILLQNFIDDYNSIEDEFEKNHVRALGWLLSKGLLEIRIAVLKNGRHILTRSEIDDSGIMHQKVGILYDECSNILSFSGSNNESASGWLRNTEEFKVFCSWDSGYPYYKDDIAKFESFWNKKRVDADILDLPEALEKQLIKEGEDFDIDLMDVKKYYPSQTFRKKQELKLFYYQQEAVDMWNSNERSLLLQMATGCGKTRTAIGCMSKALTDTSPMLIVISTPQATLSTQWRKDIEGLDVPSEYSMEVNGTVQGWPQQVKKNLLKLAQGYFSYFILYVTHDICCSQTFTEIIQHASSTITKFLIGDEVHGLGAPQMQNALLDCYRYRLGLSATPQRWFDDKGSKLIEEYFGNKSYIFGIDKALSEYNPLTHKHFLVQYTYYPVFVTMTDDEMAEYQRLTLSIARKSGKDSTDDDLVQLLRFKRANIEKSAENKYLELKKILDKIGPEINDTIIFVSPEQIDTVIGMLAERHIASAPYTNETGTRPSKEYGGLSEREFIINKFKERRYKALVAIKCLDEGIDIPSADTAIIMASSTNPREYVQRIGRVIRQAPGKGQATIYDMVIIPEFKQLREDKVRELEQRIFYKELDRVTDISLNSINNVDVAMEISRAKREAVL